MKKRCLRVLLYRSFIIYLKIIPMLLGLLNFSSLVLLYHKVKVPIIDYLANISFLPLSFIYVASYVFRFCEYHRMPLHYIIVTDLIEKYNNHIGKSLADQGLLLLYLILLFISIIITIILYVKSNKKSFKASNKRYRWGKL